MTFADPVGDMITRIRNAQLRTLHNVKIPSSKFRAKILDVLKKEGYISDYKIINDFFTEKTFPPETFDVIIFRNLLEHLYDIHGFLDSVETCLKKEGRIFVDVPNVDEILKIGGFGTFFHQHVSYFSMNTLTHFLSLHGFRIEQSYAGTPNLFISAIKKTESIKTPFTFPRQIKKEREKGYNTRHSYREKIETRSF